MMKQNKKDWVSELQRDVMNAIDCEKKLWYLKKYPCRNVRVFFFMKFLFRTDMLEQHRLLKSVKVEKNINICQLSANFCSFRVFFEMFVIR
ncbi:MAG: hypothetical protein ACI93P_000247 [bacterium]|jgi:hypothetical protein